MCIDHKHLLIMMTVGSSDLSWINLIAEFSAFDGKCPFITLKVTSDHQLSLIKLVFCNDTLS